ncbi:hypothetical protein ABW19_dt0208728 [Dactylella cylindrospora]|nr:hypothetical protein ABW19_dt0208728 [Dactylella cylindrospora]
MSQLQSPSKEGTTEFPTPIDASTTSSTLIQPALAAEKVVSSPSPINIPTSSSRPEEPELDEFGLPVFKPVTLTFESSDGEDEEEGLSDKERRDGDVSSRTTTGSPVREVEGRDMNTLPTAVGGKVEENQQENHKADPRPPVIPVPVKTVDSDKPVEAPSEPAKVEAASKEVETEPSDIEPSKPADPSLPTISKHGESPPTTDEPPQYTPLPAPAPSSPHHNRTLSAPNQELPSASPLDPTAIIHPKPAISEWSHQQSALPEKEKKDNDDDMEWQEMPSYAPYDIYDDSGKLIAKEHHFSDDDEENDEIAAGGASKGYTRVQMDEDARSTTSMDENTQHLFKESEEDVDRNPLNQLETTKDLLTEGQRIAYVGLCRLALVDMLKEMERLKIAKKSWAKKSVGIAAEHMKMWSQIVMVRLYKHMDISPAEQIMIEQLSEHGVVASDLTPTLMKNARVKNPMAAEEELKSPRNSTSASGTHTPAEGGVQSSTTSDSKKSLEKRDSEENYFYADPPPPAYEEHMNDELPAVRTPSQLPDGKTLDIDIRWTVLCDLFLVLISDSVYDARSRVLLELVGEYLSISWIDICKFEKKVTDALEMQENTTQNWNESDILEDRARRARNRRYAMMGLATLGGGLVIGLSAGLLAPVIGAGLAAGFTTIGITSTGAFLGGTGGAALITTAATISGSAIAGKAAGKRTKNVSVFEFRPLYNNKRVNLIVTISGWMNGKEDDVRLPYSTVDPIMGDIFSVSWEPEMMQSMGQTINILATEVLTQSLQQVLGSTVLMALMASLQVPLILTKLSYLLDNPWNVSLDRAWASGLILADTLIQRNLGVRPITLVGFSLGARVIYSCLLELAKRNAHGLVQNVYMFGSPVVANKEDYLAVSAVVRGRFVNGYCTNDWILGYLFRATSGGIGRVAGLAPISDVPGIENLDCTDYVVGHMAYRTAIPSLLKKVGWEVISEEFTEIEEADPDKLRERQTELISEIEAARKELEKEPTKRKWGLFGKNKDVAKKQEWEMYSEEKHPNKTGDEKKDYDSDEDKDDRNENVLFDVEAIRRELALQEIEEREKQKGGNPRRDSEITSRPALAHTSIGEYEKDRVADSLSVSKTRSSMPVSGAGTPKMEAKSPSSTVRSSRNFSFGIFGRKDSADKAHSAAGSASGSRTGSVVDLNTGSNGNVNRSTPDLSRNSLQAHRTSTSSYNMEPKSPYHGYSYDDEFGDDHGEGRIQMTFEDSKWDYDDDEVRQPPKPPPKPQDQSRRAVSYWGQTSGAGNQGVESTSSSSSPRISHDARSDWSGNAGNSGGGALPVLNKGSVGVPQRHSSLSYYNSAAPGYGASSGYGGGSSSGLGISGGASSAGYSSTTAQSTAGGKDKPLPSNPWADDDDDFGREQEMTLSFE